MVSRVNIRKVVGSASWRMLAYARAVALRLLPGQHKRMEVDGVTIRMGHQTDDLVWVELESGGRRTTSLARHFSTGFYHYIDPDQMPVTSASDSGTRWDNIWSSLTGTAVTRAAGLGVLNKSLAGKSFAFLNFRNNPGAHGLRAVFADAVPKGAISTVFTDIFGDSPSLALTDPDLPMDLTVDESAETLEVYLVSGPSQFGAIDPDTLDSVVVHQLVFNDYGTFPGNQTIVPTLAVQRDGPGAHTMTEVAMPGTLVDEADFDLRGNYTAVQFQFLIGLIGTGSPTGGGRFPAFTVMAAGEALTGVNVVDGVLESGSTNGIVYDAWLYLLDDDQALVYEYPQSFDSVYKDIDDIGSPATVSNFQSRCYDLVGHARGDGGWAALVSWYPLAPATASFLVAGYAVSGSYVGWVDQSGAAEYRTSALPDVRTVYGTAPSTATIGSVLAEQGVRPGAELKIDDDARATGALVYSTVDSSGSPKWVFNLVSFNRGVNQVDTISVNGASSLTVGKCWAHTEPDGSFAFALFHDRNPSATGVGNQYLAQARVHVYEDGVAVGKVSLVGTGSVLAPPDTGVMHDVSVSADEDPDTGVTTYTVTGKIDAVGVTGSTLAGSAASGEYDFTLVLPVLAGALQTADCTFAIELVAPPPQVFDDGSLVNTILHYPFDTDL